MNITITNARRKWAYSLIRRAKEPPPPYGSAEWLRLAEGSAEKIASVVIAAESHARAGDDLPLDLAREIDARRAADDEHYRALHRQAAERVAQIVKLPDYREKRRRELDAAQPRPGDFPGRSGGGAA